MHPDVEPFASEAAERQKAFFAAFARLNGSMERLRTADYTDLSYYKISEEHSRLFKEWIDSNRELQKAVREMHRAALTAAGVPPEHPLWKLAGD